MTPDFPIELDWLKRWARYSPDKVAVQSGETGRAFTYSDLFNRSLALAKALSDNFGVVRGDRVAVVAQNELEYVSLFFAVQRLGAILVPINFRFQAAEVAHIVSDCGARLVIAQNEFWGSVSSLKNVKLWKFEDLSGVPATGAPETPIVGSVEDICMILYTSGTTGFPKGAMLSNRMLFWNSINTGLRLNLTQNDVVLTFLPLFHTGGWNVLTTPCLHRGAKVVLLRKFDADLVLRLSESEKVSVLFGVPTTMDFVRRSPQFDSTDLTSIRYAVVGGEPMPLELIQAWGVKGIPVRQGYGLTEFGPNVFSLNEEDSARKMGSIGFPNFYIDARVVDDAGKEVLAGEVGELVLRGPVMMSGYWGNPKATNETIRDGWLHTGDFVKRDTDGYFYVVGRKKEMFISGGENVYPAEIERVLRALPEIAEAAVIGVPDPKWGESGRAYVVFESGRSLSPDELRYECQRSLAKYKIPREFVVMASLPKTESGKVAKSRLTI